MRRGFSSLCCVFFVFCTMSSISFLSPHAPLLSYASPNSTKLRTNPWKPYLLPNPIHGAISSSSAATMSHDSRQNPLTDILNLDSGSDLDPYPYFYPKIPSNAESDVMRRLLRERVVFVMGDIDGSAADKIIFQLLMLDAEDPTKDIKIFIDTHRFMPLGTAWIIYDVMRFVKADVSTIVLGFAASPASIILCGGTKGKRFAMPNARIVPRHAIGFNIQPKKAMHDKSNVFSASRFDQVQEIPFVSPIEAVKYGLIDRIIDRDYMVSLMPAADKVEPKVNDGEMNKGSA